MCPHLSGSSTGKKGEDKLVGTAELEKVWGSGDNGSCHSEGLNRLKEQGRALLDAHSGAVTLSGKHTLRKKIMCYLADDGAVKLHAVDENFLFSSLA